MLHNSATFAYNSKTEVGDVITYNASFYEVVVLFIATNAVGSTASFFILEIEDRADTFKSARQRFDYKQSSSML